MIWVFDAQNVISETWNHEELLIQAVHIADATEILNADTTCRRFLIVVEFDLPIMFFLSSPGSFRVEMLQVNQHLAQILKAVSTQNVYQVQSDLPCAGRLTLWSTIFLAALVSVRDFEQTIF